MPQSFLEQQSLYLLRTPELWELLSQLPLYRWKGPWMARRSLHAGSNERGCYRTGEHVRHKDIKQGKKQPEISEIQSNNFPYQDGNRSLLRPGPNQLQRCGQCMQLCLQYWPHTLKTANFIYDSRWKDWRMETSFASCQLDAEDLQLFDWIRSEKIKRNARSQTIKASNRFQSRQVFLLTSSEQTSYYAEASTEFSTTRR